MEMARSQRRLVSDADWMLNVRESSPTDVVMRYRHQGGSASDLVGAVVSNGAKGVLRRGWGRLRERAAARRRRS
jgi:L-asparaginase/Glu-tRNA(Gln) amidotransferase subunit D